MTYDYFRAVKDDLIQFIKDEYDPEEYYDLEDFREAVDGGAWIADQVTGNASGSYTFSTWQAEENLSHNWDLLEEALSEFGQTFDPEKGAEHYDVTIRCYVLGQVLDEAIEEAGIDEDSFRNNEEVQA